MKEVKKIGNILVIDGKYYQFTNKYGKKGEMVFKPIDKEKFEKITDSITKKLEPSLEKKDIIKDALGELPLENLEKLHDVLFKKKKKPKVRQRYGCVELVVGREVIPIR